MNSRKFNSGSVTIVVCVLMLSQELILKKDSMTHYFHIISLCSICELNQVGKQKLNVLNNNYRTDEIQFRYLRYIIINT